MTDEERKKKNRIRVQEYRIRTGKTKNPGVGKGGNPLRGKDSPCYRNGVKQFERDREHYRMVKKYCEHCGENLQDAKPYYWVIHHKDHNRDNNTWDNYALLCKRCHQIHHKCEQHLPQNM